MAFPLSPTDGQTYTTALGTQYTYVLADTAWKISGGLGSTGNVTGTGTATYLPMWSDTSALSDSPVYASGNTVVMGGTDSSGIITLYSTSSDTTTQSLATNVGCETADPGTFTRSHLPVYTRKDMGTLTDDGVLVIAPVGGVPMVANGYVWASTGLSAAVHTMNFSVDFLGVSIFNGVGSVANVDTDDNLCVYYEYSPDSGEFELSIKNRLGATVNIGYTIDYFINELV